MVPNSAPLLIVNTAIKAGKCLDVENISKIQVLALPLVEVAFLDYMKLSELSLRLRRGEIPTLVFSRSPESANTLE